MINKQTGCYYCFRTLDPQAHQRELQQFVRCAHCDISYHEICWHQSKKCLRCNGAETESFEILTLPLLPVLAKMEALPAKPSSIVHSVAGIGIVVSNSTQAVLEGFSDTKFAKHIENNPFFVTGIILIILSFYCGLMCLTCIALSALVGST